MTEQLAGAGRRLEALHLLPTPFPIQELLSAREFRHVERLFGIGGLVLGRPLQGAVAVVASVLLTWYLVTATRPAAGSETSVV